MENNQYAYIPQETKEPNMGLIFNKDSKLVLTLDIGYGRLLLEMFAILEEKGLLSKDTAELYDLLKRQIPT